MRDRELYARILGLEPPWKVTEVELLEAESGAGDVVVHVEHVGKAPCPQCGRLCARHDSLPRRWRHLDTCQYRTILSAKVPRSECPDHGVLQIRVPWADEKSRFTALFERMAIDWMLEAGRAATARRMGLTWDEADGIMARAVARGLARRGAETHALIGVDEKSFQKGHEYVTVVCDLVERTVLYVGDHRTKEALDGYYESLSETQLSAIQAVAMDMCQAYVSSTKAKVPDGGSKIVFDKFHVAKQLSAAVDQVRRSERKRLAKEGDDRLTGTRYVWLRNPLRESAEQSRSARSLRSSLLATARAWRLKETFMDFFDYRYAGAARKFFDRWYSWAIRSRLDPIKKAARTFKEKLENLLTYVRTPITNAVAESLNAKIQWIKYTAHGFRSREGFKNAIYFHCGGLDMYPKAHTNSG